MNTLRPSLSHSSTETIHVVRAAELNWTCGGGGGMRAAELNWTCRGGGGMRAAELNWTCGGV